MVEVKDSGLYDIWVGTNQVFSELEFDEGLSALLTLADHHSGVAFINGEEIARFNG